MWITNVLVLHWAALENRSLSVYCWQRWEATATTLWLLHLQRLLLQYLNEVKQLMLSLNCFSTSIIHQSRVIWVKYWGTYCKLIVWNKSTKTHKHGFEALDRTLQNSKNNNRLMGSVTVLLDGYYRQTLPVVLRGTWAEEVKTCIKASHLFPLICKLLLKKIREFI